METNAPRDLLELFLVMMLQLNFSSSSHIQHQVLCSNFILPFITLKEDGESGILECRFK